MPFLSSFLRDTTGNVAMLFSVSMIPVLGVVGAALDYQRASSARTEMQASVDSAALAGALADVTSDSERSLASRNFAMANLRGTGVSDNPAELASLVVSASVKDKIVTVTASDVVETKMISVVGIDTIPISATASAIKDSLPSPVCILALNKTVSKAVSFGGNSTFIAKDCYVQANSSSADALSIAGSAIAKAAGFCAVGGFSAPPGQNPMPHGRCLPATDTYANLKSPIPAKCTGATTSVSVQPNKSRTLSPGTYCNGLDLKGNVTFSPGLYIIDGGSLSINSQATVKGTGVTFFFMGSGAGFSINGGGKIDLSAPTSAGDPYQGMLLVQDRHSNVGATSSLNGNSDTVLKGVIYAPTQEVSMNGTGLFGQVSPFMPIIADTIKITGNAGATADTAALGTTAPVPTTPTGARLVY
jgi:hypothetical protein